MKRTKGFTLVELLVVVAIIALLVSILLPTLGKAKELAKQAICGGNLKGLGSALTIYQTENNDNQPYIETDGTWAGTFENTGIGADNGASQPGTVSPTAVMFLMVRSGQPVDMFRCPSDSNATKMASAKFTSGGNSYYYWDFYDEDIGTDAAHCSKISYSFQAPLRIDPGETLYRSGVSGGSGLAIMADKTPVFDGKDLCDWSDDDSSSNKYSDGMSQNHGNGEFINVLFADFHVKGGARADVGIGYDNIYSVGDADGGSQESTSAPTNCGAHEHVDDSYLIGPVNN